MSEPIIIRVDQFSEFMAESDFENAIKLMEGSLAQEGNDFTILHCVAPDPGRARKAFVDEMQRQLGEANNHLIWRYKPEVGTRREGANIVYVCSARFRVEQPAAPEEDPE